jgi:type IV secretion system protein VirB11
MGQTITQLLTEKDVVEIMLNPDGKLWVERLGQEMQPVGEMVASQAESLMATVASTINTTITSEKPILECELPIDGSRFEALIPPIVSAPTFTIRKKAYKIFTLDDYVNDGIMSSDQREMIISSVKNRKNILVVGGTGTGKTTLTNAIIEAISTYTPDHRLAIIEDTGEIQCSSKNVVIMRSTEHVSMLRLLKATMRLRPDRILVGEVRGEEALALLKAWNTGHPGGVATVHANDARAGLIRMEQLISEATPAPQQQLIAEAVDVVICIVKSEGGRKVKEIISVDGYRNNDYQLTTIN